MRAWNPLTWALPLALRWELEMMGRDFAFVQGGRVCSEKGARAQLDDP